MLTGVKSNSKIYLALDSIREMSDEAFARFTVQAAPYQFEREPDGTVIMMEPTVTYSGYLNSTLSGELYSWNQRMKLGYLFDSSTGFKLPDGSVRSPDAAFVLKDRWKSLTDKEQNSYAPICPDFLVELKSPSDDLEELQEKMQMYMNNGCRLGWLIDTERERVFIYRSLFEFEVIEGFNKKISGEDILPGFEFDLSILKR